MNYDGIIDRFSFKIKNPLYSAYYRRPRIAIDGKIIEEKDIIIKTRNGRFNMENWNDKNPLPLIPSELMEILIKRPGGLKKGKHRIEILDAKIVGFDTSILEFIDEIR